MPLVFQYFDFGSMSYQDVPTTDRVSFIISGLPSGVTFDRARWELTGTPKAAGAYETSIEACAWVDVEDGYFACDDASFAWTVNALPAPPDVRPAPPQVKPALPQKQILTPVAPKPAKPVATSRELAHTGSDTGDPMLAALGLIGLGGCAVVARRRLLASKR